MHRCLHVRKKSHSYRGKIGMTQNPNFSSWSECLLYSRLSTADSPVYVMFTSHAQTKTIQCTKLRFAFHSYNGCLFINTFDARCAAQTVCSIFFVVFVLYTQFTKHNISSIVILRSANSKHENYVCHSRRCLGLLKICRKRESRRWHMYIVQLYVWMYYIVDWMTAKNWMKLFIDSQQRSFFSRAPLNTKIGATNRVNEFFLFLNIQTTSE